MPRTSSRTSSADADTIVAVASPPGRGLRAIVRLSGPLAASIGGRLSGAVHLPSPRTYTREDVVEIHLPGSPPLVEGLLRYLVGQGARPARPGEFTLRAFLNGRLDLAQAEAVGLLVAAEDEEDRRAALGQLSGHFSSLLRGIEGRVLDLCADAEAAIDFVDQDIEILSVAEAVSRAECLLGELRNLLGVTAASALPDHRPTLVLYGRPNAGKSALFNALTGSDALVTPVAGTTRDVLSAELDVGVPTRLMDTAGDQAAGGPDAQAVLRGRDSMKGADVVIFVVDATDWESSIAIEPRGIPAVLVLNKCDLEPGRGVRTRFHIREAVCASARTGEGLPELRRILSAMLGAGPSEAAGARFRLNLRQFALLREAEAALERSGSAAAGLGMEFVALDLRAALDALGGITGRQVGEDLLDRIFSRFCLGK
jgi:tRNA modification GTPase